MVKAKPKKTSSARSKPAVKPGKAAPAKAAAGKPQPSKVVPSAKSPPGKIPAARAAATNNKPSSTPGKPFPPMSTRKPESGKSAPGATVPPSGKNVPPTGKSASPAGKAALPAGKSAPPAGKTTAKAGLAARHGFMRPPPRPEKPEPPKLKKSPYGKSDLKPMRQALLELRSRLQGAIDKLGNEALRADEPDTDSEDVADHGSDAFERNMTLGLMENEARTLHQIEDALEQMEGGRYGVCILCGQAIPLARLEALPFATTCVPCQEKAERRL
ncbi:MAG TPA: TraR/DksA C4-type zinc finger protein [Planctomycetota bacterium]|nr:TraR/DksA C4-type zinc finger protein [Planctomycetota bacterium]